MKAIINSMTSIVLCTAIAIHVAGIVWGTVATVVIIIVLKLKKF